MAGKPGPNGGTDPTADSSIQEAMLRWMEKWSGLWRTVGLVEEVRVEFSARMTRSLGRCYPSRGLIRLHAELLHHADNGTSEYIREVLCHELAHLAAYRLHGLRIRPHGPEWKRLVRQAGYQPSTRLSVPIQTRSPRRPRSSGIFEHRCPVCRVFRYARRRMRSWRCMVCLKAGRAGELLITTLRGA